MWNWFNCTNADKEATDQNEYSKHFIPKKLFLILFQSEN